MWLNNSSLQMRMNIATREPRLWPLCHSANLVRPIEQLDKDIQADQLGCLSAKYHGGLEIDNPKADACPFLRRNNQPRTSVRVQLWLIMFVSILMLFPLSLSYPAIARGLGQSAQISGLVADPSKASISDASIEIVNQNIDIRPSPSLTDPDH